MDQENMRTQVVELGDKVLVLLQEYPAVIGALTMQNILGALIGKNAGNRLEERCEEVCRNICIIAKEYSAWVKENPCTHGGEDGDKDCD